MKTRLGFVSNSSSSSFVVSVDKGRKAKFTIEVDLEEYAKFIIEDEKTLDKYLDDKWGGYDKEYRDKEFKEYKKLLGEGKIILAGNFSSESDYKFSSTFYENGLPEDLDKFGINVLCDG